MSILKRMTSVAQDLENEIQANFSSSEYNPWTDIQTSDEKHTIELSVPDCSKENLQIQISEDRVLMIQGPNLTRSIYLPEDANLDQITAAINNGLLLIEIPKMKQVLRILRSIDVN